MRHGIMATPFIIACMACLARMVLGWYQVVDQTSVHFSHANAARVSTADALLFNLLTCSFAIISMILATIRLGAGCIARARCNCPCSAWIDRKSVV